MRCANCPLYRYYSNEDGSFSECVLFGDDPDQNASEPTKYQKQSWRNELIKLLKAKGIDVNEYATAHGLSKSTTEDEYRDLVMDLRGE